MTHNNTRAFFPHLSPDIIYKIVNVCTYCVFWRTNNKILLSFHQSVLFFVSFFRGNIRVMYRYLQDNITQTYKMYIYIYKYVNICIYTVYIYAGHCNTALNWWSYRESILTILVFVLFFTSEPLLPVTNTHTRALPTARPRASSLFLSVCYFNRCL